MPVCKARGEIGGVVVGDSSARGTETGTCVGDTSEDDEDMAGTWCSYS